MAVVGTVAAVLGFFIGLYFAVQRMRNAKEAAQKKDEKEANRRTAQILEKQALLEQAQNGYERQYQELRAYVESQFKEISSIVKEIQSHCVRHRQSTALEDVQRSLATIAQRLDTATSELQKHKEQCAERYLTITGYQNDLTMWTTSFDTLRQSLRDVNALVTRLLNGRR